MISFLPPPQKARVRRELLVIKAGMEEFKTRVENNERVRNRIDSINLRGGPFETHGLDSGFRRRDEFQASPLCIIPGPLRRRFLPLLYFSHLSIVCRQIINK
jgi:hypothetical protein